MLPKHRQMSNIDQKAPDCMRLDKWLWCARFFKTRSLATSAIKAGKIKTNGSRVKSGRMIHVGDKLSICCGPFQYDVSVSALAKSRGPVSDASRLYDESAESIRKRDALALQLELAAATRVNTQGRPGKHERRKIIRFTRQTPARR